MSKTDLAARPMFVRKRDAIEAHLTIVFTALAVAREIQNRTGLAIRNVIRQLRPLRSAKLAVNGAVQAFRPPSTQAGRQSSLRSPATGLTDLPQQGAPGERDDDHHAVQRPHADPLRTCRAPERGRAPATRGPGRTTSPVDLESELETKVTAVLAPDYQAQLASARQRVRDPAQ
jgi:hypothetical protein